MKITKDASGKTTVDFMGAVLPDGRKIEDLLKNRFANGLIDVLREFGIMGVITYVGGFVILVFFPFQENLTRQILFAITGLFLLSLSTFISYFRIKSQRDREKALIEMTQNTGNRLAEQLGSKGLTNEQVVSITQTIWQNQKDLIFAILGIAKTDKLKKSEKTKR